MTGRNAYLFNCLIEFVATSIAEVREKKTEKLAIYSTPTGDIEVIIRPRIKAEPALEIIVDDTLPEGHWELGQRIAKGLSEQGRS